MSMIIMCAIYDYFIVSSFTGFENCIDVTLLAFLNLPLAQLFSVIFFFLLLFPGIEM